MDYLDELENELKNTATPVPALDEPTVDVAAIQARLDALEAANKELQDKNRKLTQFALGDQLSPDDYNAQLKQALDTNPLGYTQEVVNTTKTQVMNEVDKKIQEAQQAQQAQLAVMEAQRKYPELTQYQQEIGLYADSIYAQVQSGQHPTIKTQDYGKIIDEAVKTFRQRFPGAVPGRGQHVMSLDVGIQPNTAYGTDSELGKLNSLNDEDFLRAMNKVATKGAAFNF